MVFDPEGRLTVFGVRRHDSGGDPFQRVSWQDRTKSGEVVHPGTNRPMTLAQDLLGLTTWTMDGLHWCCFGTWGAALARTEFDHRQAPVKTVFEDTRNQRVFWIDYDCDAHRKILEAVQFTGPAPPFWALALMSSVADRGSALPESVDRPDASGELFRFSFRYDEGGRMIEQECKLCGRPMHHRLASYNQQGDMSTLDEGGNLTRLQYEYDDRGNWIRRVIHYSPPNSPADCRRTIHYYKEV